jgi:triacylglycerol lipase
MLARLQQAITLGALMLAAGWAWLCWQQGHPLWALAGALLIVGGYALVLGLEFSLLRLAHGADDPTPRASRRSCWQPGGPRCRRRRPVFCWRQPFFSQRWPDHLPADASGRRGVLLVHGFVCNRGLWNPWLQRLQPKGCPSSPSIWSRCSAPSTTTSASWNKPCGGWRRPRALRR